MDRGKISPRLSWKQASVVVASALPIPDTLGSVFAEALYRRGTAFNEPFLVAFSRARALVEKAARKKQSRYWASWSLFTYSGNPYTMLPHDEAIPDEGLWSKIMGRAAEVLGLREEDLSL